MTKFAPNLLRTASWVLYDLANTIYAATVTFLFTPFATEALGGKSGIGYVQLASMALAAALVPALGALADHTARTRSYLAMATLLCIVAMAGFGLDLGPWWLLVCFFVANLTFNFGLLFYNSLLPAVADDASTGRISGIGVGVGYLGTILVLATLLPLDTTASSKFQLAAGMFLVLSLPCLLFVRDPRQSRPGTGVEAMRESLATLMHTVKGLRKQPAFAWFLLGNFCLVDVLNTAVLYFADFTTDTFRAAAAAGTLDLFGFSFTGPAGLRNFLMWMGLLLNCLAFTAGLSIGRWTDRSPLAVMKASGVALLIALFGGALFGGTSALGYLLTLVALGAFGLAGIWTSGRKLVVMLAPKQDIGAYFGLYGITVKLSVFGGAVYGVVADKFGCKPAMLAQSVQLVLGLCCLAMVRLQRPGDAPSPDART